MRTPSNRGSRSWASADRRNLPDCLLPYKWGLPAKMRFLQADLNADLDRIMTVVEGWRPQYVVNYAAQGMVAQSWSDPGQWFQTNTLAMVRLHDRLRKCTFLEKYLQISTPEVYGSTAGIVREDAQYNPSTPYAASKAACDLSLISFLKGYGFPVVFTRSANVCGPGQQLYRVIPKTVISVLSGKRLRLEGGGQSRRSFIHIRDVVEGQMQALLRGRPGDIFHLSTNRIASIREVVAMICASCLAGVSKTTWNSSRGDGAKTLSTFSIARRRIANWPGRLPRLGLCPAGNRRLGPPRVGSNRRPAAGIHP